MRRALSGSHPSNKEGSWLWGEEATENSHTEEDVPGGLEEEGFGLNGSLHTSSFTFPHHLTKTIERKDEENRRKDNSNETWEAYAASRNGR